MPDDSDIRQIAREEARAVYDELGVVDADGEVWTLRGLMDRFKLDRRTALQALGLIAVGYAAPTAALNAMTGTAKADATGEEGTQSDPLTKVWMHAFESGDGADALSADDAIVFANESVNSATTIGSVMFVYYDSSVSGFTITVPASLEQKGIVLRFIDETGNAASNSVDVTSTNWDIGGSGTVTIDASDTVYEMFGDGAEWLDGRFIPSVVAGSLGNDWEDPSNVAGSRSFDTEFQNTNDHNLYVSVELESDGTQEINARIEFGNTSGSLNIIDFAIIHAADISDVTRLTLGPVQIPPDGFYQVSAGAPNSSTINRWNEWGAV